MKRVQGFVAGLLTAMIVMAWVKRINIIQAREYERLFFQK